MKIVKILMIVILFQTVLIGSSIIANEKTLEFKAEAQESIRWMEEYNGGLLLAGFSNAKGTNGGFDFVLKKTDLFGNIQWEKFYGSTNDERGYVVKQVPGGMIYGGAMLSANYDDLRNTGGWDGLLLKLDSSGNILWKKNYGGSEGDSIRDVIHTNDNGFIFCGYTFSESYENHHGGKDFWIVKTDHNGEIQWEKVLGGSQYDMAYSVVQTRDNHYVVAGYSFSTNGDLSGMENHGNGDYWIIKLDYYGNIVWSKLYGGSGWEEVRQVIETRDRGFLLAGVASSKNGDVKDSKGRWDAWLVKLDRNGDLEWEKTYGGSSYDKAFSVQQLSDRGFVVAGMTKSNDGDVENHYGDSDVWVFRTDKNGGLMWEHTIGGKESESAEKVLRLKDGRYAVAWGEFAGNESFAGDDGRRYDNFKVTLFFAN
jgi:hypothetical protein